MIIDQNFIVLIFSTVSTNTYQIVTYDLVAQS